MSILFFYLRIFPDKWFRFSVFALMSIVAAHAVSIIMTAFFQCTPFAYAWDKTIHGGRCINQNAFERWISFPNVVIDLGILCLPQPLVWSLHTSFYNKGALSFLFILGSL